MIIRVVHIFYKVCGASKKYGTDKFRSGKNYNSVGYRKEHLSPKSFEKKPNGSKSYQFYIEYQTFALFCRKHLPKINTNY